MVVKLKKLQIIQIAIFVKGENIKLFNIICLLKRLSVLRSNRDSYTRQSRNISFNMEVDNSQSLKFDQIAVKQGQKVFHKNVS